MGGAYFRDVAQYLGYAFFRCGGGLLNFSAVYAARVGGALSAGGAEFLFLNNFGNIGFYYCDTWIAIWYYF